MNITVYLPNELGQRAKGAKVNLSRMLRDALTRRFHIEDTTATTLEQGSEEVALDLAVRDDCRYVGRFHAAILAENVFLTRDGSVVRVRPHRSALLDRARS